MKCGWSCSIGCKRRIFRFIGEPLYMKKVTFKFFSFASCFPSKKETLISSYNVSKSLFMSSTTCWLFVARSFAANARSFLFFMNASYLSAVLCLVDQQPGLCGRNTMVYRGHQNFLFVRSNGLYLGIFDQRKTLPQKYPSHLLLTKWAYLSRHGDYLSDSKQCLQVFDQSADRLLRVDQLISQDHWEPIRFWETHLKPCQLVYQKRNAFLSSLHLIFLHDWCQRDGLPFSK